MYKIIAVAHKQKCEKMCIIEYNTTEDAALRVPT